MKILEHMRDRQSLYLWGILFPFVIFVLSIAIGIKSIVAVVAIYFGVSMAVVSVIDMKFLRDVFLKKTSQETKKYMSKIRDIIFFVFSLGLFLYTVPYYNNAVLIPLAILSTLIVGLYSIGKKEVISWQKISNGLAITMLVISLFGFFFPKTFSSLEKVDLDKGLSTLFESKPVSTPITTPASIPTSTVSPSITPTSSGSIEKKFDLIVGTAIPTIRTNPGEFYKLTSNKEFVGVSKKGDYLLSSETIWGAGTYPAALFLKAKFPNTRVSIRRVVRNKRGGWIRSNSLVYSAE